MKERLALAWYLFAVWGFFVLLCIAPERALAVQYSRVVTLAARQAYVQANTTALSTYVAQRALAPTAGSLALRLVPGVGWAALGISAGTALYGYYYSQPDLDAAKAGGTTATATIPDPKAAATYSNLGPCPGTTGCPTTGNYDGIVTFNWDNFRQYSDCPTYWNGAGPVPGSNGLQAYCVHPTGQPNAPVFGTSAPTEQTIINYINTQNNYHTNHEAAAASPTGDNNVNIPVSSTDVPSVVKDSATVLPTDKVIAVGVAPPSGTQATDTSTQQATTTTTTTTNPDGSTTEQDTSTANVSCVYGEHDGRTMATVFQEHQGVWQSSGLLSLLATFQSLTWPTSLPTISIASNVFGTQAIDFNQWAGIFTIIRTLVIATTSFIAVRYVFAGGA